MTVGHAPHVRQHEMETQMRGQGARTEESDSFPTVEQTVVVRERDDHDRADDDLAIDDDRSVLDRVHPCTFKVSSPGTALRRNDEEQPQVRSWVACRKPLRRSYPLNVP